MKICLLFTLALLLSSCQPTIRELPMDTHPAFDLQGAPRRTRSAARKHHPIAEGGLAVQRNYPGI